MDDSEQQQLQTLMDVKPLAKNVSTISPRPLFSVWFI
jgi:hypothetical protein